MENCHHPIFIWIKIFFYYALSISIFLLYYFSMSSSYSVKNQIINIVNTVYFQFCLFYEKSYFYSILYFLQRSRHLFILKLLPLALHSKKESEKSTFLLKCLCFFLSLYNQNASAKQQDSTNDIIRCSTW